MSDSFFFFLIFLLLLLFFTLQYCIGFAIHQHAILYDSMYCSTTGFPIQHQPPELTQTHVHRLGDSKQPSHPLSSPSPPALNLSQHQGLFNGSAVGIRWPKYWSFRFTISPSNKYSGLISFRMDWFDLLAVQGTLKCLLQHQSSKASILWHSAFFIVQFSHPYMTTGKTIALTSWTYVGKEISLLVNLMSRLTRTFIPRSKRLLISWLQSISAVILEPPKNKVCHCFHCFLHLFALKWGDHMPWS